MKKYLLEVCVDSVESAIAAQKGGADRIELCSNLLIGGTTPSMSLYTEIRKQIDIPIHILIRPRFGDFCYSEYEYKIMTEDIKAFQSAGANGVVIGCLLPNGTLDIEKLHEMIHLAKNMHVTLHRAFDVCADPFQAFDDAMALGIQTILTSGQKAECTDGIELLAQLTAHAKKLSCNHFSSDTFNRQICGDNATVPLPKKFPENTTIPQIMAGSGISPDNLAQVAAATGVTTFHMSGKKIIDSRMIYRKEGVPMGLPLFSEYAKWQTDENTIRTARNILDNL